MAPEEENEVEENWETAGAAVLELSCVIQAGPGSRFGDSNEASRHPFAGREKSRPLSNSNIDISDLGAISIGGVTARGSSAGSFADSLDNQWRGLKKSRLTELSQLFSAARTPPAPTTRRTSRTERRAPFAIGFIE